MIETLQLYKVPKRAGIGSKRPIRRGLPVFDYVDTGPLNRFLILDSSSSMRLQFQEIIIYYSCGWSTWRAPAFPLGAADEKRNVRLSEDFPMLSVNSRLFEETLGGKRIEIERIVLQFGTWAEIEA